MRTRRGRRRHLRQVVAEATSLVDRKLYHDRHIRGHVEQYLAIERSSLLKKGKRERG